MNHQEQKDIKISIFKVEIRYYGHNFAPDLQHFKLLLKFLELNSINVKKVDFDATMNTVWYVLPENVVIEYGEWMIVEGI